MHEEMATIEIKLIIGEYYFTKIKCVTTEWVKKKNGYTNTLKSVKTTIFVTT